MTINSKINLFFMLEGLIDRAVFTAAPTIKPCVANCATDRHKVIFNPI